MSLETAYWGLIGGLATTDYSHLCRGVPSGHAGRRSRNDQDGNGNCTGSEKVVSKSDLVCRGTGADCKEL